MARAILASWRLLTTMWMRAMHSCRCFEFQGRECGGYKVGHAIRKLWRRIAVTKYPYLAEVVASQLNDAHSPLESATVMLGVPRPCNQSVQVVSWQRR